MTYENQFFVEDTAVIFPNSGILTCCSRSICVALYQEHHSVTLIFPIKLKAIQWRSAKTIQYKTAISNNVQFHTFSHQHVSSKPYRTKSTQQRSFEQP